MRMHEEAENMIFVSWRDEPYKFDVEDAATAFQVLCNDMVIDSTIRQAHERLR